MRLVETHIFKEVHDKIEFLIIKRKDDDTYGGVWQMVTGGIINGEKAYEAAVREVKEETGCDAEKLWIVPKVNSFYSPDEDRIISIPVFLIRVKPNQDIKLSSEHTEFMWVNSEDAKRYFIWEGQRESVDLIVQYLTIEGNTLNFNEIELKK